jgi:hypothetical protein
MSPVTQPELPADAVELLRTLTAHRVDFVLVGPLAAALHGAPDALIDDTTVIVPSRYGRNMRRLALALREIDADTHTATEGRPRPLEAVVDRLRAGSWSLTTQRGDLEVDAEPPPTLGYLELYAEARATPIGAHGPIVQVAAVDDLERIAEARKHGADRFALRRLREQRAAISG